MNTLKKEFVPYEPSLDMKELGFDEPCFGEYRQWDGNEPWLQLYQDLDGCSTDPADYEYTQEALAPTFSQAFRWFRKNHKLGAIVSQFGYGIEDEYGQIIYNIDDDEKHLCYEEAELACLIKLIEIVKNK